MGTGKRTVRSGAKTSAPDHKTLPSFEAFKGREIASIADLAAFLDEFGIKRLQIKSPASRFIAEDRREEDGDQWEIGVRLNWCFTEYYVAGTGKTLPEALERGLGIKVVSADVQSKPAAAAPAGDDDEGLLV
ncbi:hypothetical protein RCPACIFIC_56 [Rhodobacter phage RcPacific]|nr:hypothetical protein RCGINGERSNAP_56 [Rhodobacter phage RcGingersnap]QXN71723.1 hypothetical protein RCMCDREAMY_55 [Rhodobacter phage RcMcDreamy]QXN71826.1 hypothetical protein RCMRWORF_56 [Rhodobacter phage RcMrWorf]QXN72283.1 hypothetical protein RCSALEM_55 [Rhodobacter phage RcSalem]UUV42931.1 hypothetical protein RCAQUA_56 [Rhodobacter phage RcAqua]UUV43324.1 hypothetical protein RCDORA_55 [Rhodobacter phage RcDora]UUV43526.1 hypothetical protein RCJOLI_55 [Rhodobacter phage RcJoli]UU